MGIKMTPSTLSIGIAAIETILCIVVSAGDFERLPPINNPRISDTNQYRGIKLTNGLRVLLIHDAVPISAVALAVRVGAMNDVKEQPGIANLMRYLLLVANDKYSKKHKFNEYLRKHSGKLDTDFTYFHDDAEYKQYFSFEIHSSSLPKALKKFARYFIDPLFQGVDKGALKEVLGGSLKKHERLMSANKMRVYRLLKSFSEEDHPFSNLAYGTVEMLNKYAGLGDEPIDDKLRDFYSNKYSANLMCMVVLGSEDLDTLEQMVSVSFKSIKDNKQEKLVFSQEQHPWKSDQLGHKIYIVPVADQMRAIHLTFPAPDVLHQYKISPERYVIQFFNHRGPGTLGFVLQRKGLCKPRSLQAEYRLYAGIGFFTILMDLTEEGSKKVDYILGLTFQYIYLLRHNGIKEWFYKENKRLDELAFESQRYSSPLGRVQSLATAMHDYPIQDILTHEFIRDPFDRTPIDNFLSYLKPDKVNISVIDKSFGNETYNVEPWFQTKYKIEKLSPTLLQEWNSLSDLYPELGIPTPNEFIQDDPSVNTTELNEDDEDDNESEYPSVIHTSSISRIWYKSEQETPTNMIVIEINCPRANMSPLNRILTNIFVRMLIFSLEEYDYVAKSAAISYDISSTKTGFQVKLIGTNKVSVLLKTVLLRISNFEREMKEEDFKRGKQKELSVVQDLLNPKEVYHTAVFHAGYIRNEIRSTGYRMKSAIKAIFTSGLLKYETMKKFPAKLLDRIYIQGFIHGRCDREKARQIANTIDEFFTPISNGVLLQEVLHPRVVQMDFGKEFVFHTYSNSPNHYYYAYFPFTAAHTRDYTTGTIFAYIIVEACAKILPPTEMGNSECEIERVNNYYGFVIKISSPMHPHHMNLRVERFLEIMHVKLQNISDLDFTNRKLQFDMELMGHRVNDEFYDPEFYWDEIAYHNYDFEMHARENDIINGLRREDVLNLFQEVFAVGAPKRRKLVIYVFSNKLNQSIPENIATEDVDRGGMQSILIENIFRYKSSSRLCPVAVPELSTRR